MNLIRSMDVKTLATFICSLRSQLNSFQEASGGKRISVNDLVIKVCRTLIIFASKTNEIFFLFLHCEISSSSEITGCCIGST